MVCSVLSFVVAAVVHCCCLLIVACRSLVVLAVSKLLFAVAIVVSRLKLDVVWCVLCVEVIWRGVVVWRGMLLLVCCLFLDVVGVCGCLLLLMLLFVVEAAVRCWWRLLVVACCVLHDARCGC